MFRALVLLAAFCFIRTIISRRRQRSPRMSPYMNSLDGAMSAEHVSQALDRYRGVTICHR